MLAIHVLATGVKGLQLVTDVQWLDLMCSGVAPIAAVAWRWVGRTPVTSAADGG